MGGAPKGLGLRSPLPTPHVHAAPRRISERRAETRLPPGTARELNGAFSDHTTQEGGRNPSPATQSALNPGGTMHCSHSSGNKINISSPPKTPTMGLFHGRDSGTSRRPPPGRGAGCSAPAVFAQPVLGLKSPPGLAWPRLPTFWSWPSMDSGPVGGDWAQPVSVWEGKKEAREEEPDID